MPKASGATLDWYPQYAAQHAKIDATMPFIALSWFQSRGPASPVGNANADISSLQCLGWRRRSEPCPQNAPRPLLGRHQLLRRPRDLADPRLRRFGSPADVVGAKDELLHLEPVHHLR